MRNQRSRARGFTLVEMMVVVVIMGILASLAGFGWRRYVARARATEASWMLAEIASREELYKSEFAQYVPLRSDNSGAGKATFGTTGNTTTTADEPSAAFYPLDPGNTPFDSARTATSIGSVAGWPTQWRQIGLRPRTTVLYCTYFANAGVAGTTIAAAALGARMFQPLPAVPPGIPTDWYYALGACNMNGSFSWPSGETSFMLSSRSSNVVSQNDGQ